jgi:hypothetical protein
MSEVLQARSRLGNAVRTGKDADAADARRDLRAAKLEREAREAAAALPPLTDEQARRIAAILYPDGVDAA